MGSEIKPGCRARRESSQAEPHMPQQARARPIAGACPRMFKNWLGHLDFLEHSTFLRNFFVRNEMAIYKIVVFAGDHCGPEVCLLVHSLECDLERRKV